MRQQKIYKEFTLSSKDNWAFTVTNYFVDEIMESIEDIKDFGVYEIQNKIDLIIKDEDRNLSIIWINNTNKEVYFKYLIVYNTLTNNLVMYYRNVNAASISPKGSISVIFK